MGRPQMRHRITSTSLVDVPVRKVEVLTHRFIVLKNWVLKDAVANYWRIYRPLNNRGRVLYAGREIELRSGRLYLIPPQTAFDSHTTGAFTKWYAHFTLSETSLTPTQGVFEFVPTFKMRSLLALCCPEHISRAALSLEFDRSWRMIELIGHVLAEAPASLWQSPCPDARLEKAIIWMGKSIAQKITLDEICLRMSLSPRQAAKLFIRHTGFSPIRYLIELRLNHCCRLLRHTALPLEQVAEHSGFANRYYLTRMMRKYRHTSPALFRTQAALKSSR